ncbi:MAG: FIST N-terminal domain-containing protein [Chloroflexota bacterium]
MSHLEATGQPPAMTNSDANYPTIAVEVDRTGTVTGLRSVIDNILHAGVAKGLLILSCDENGFDPDVVNEILNQMPIPILGGVFPEIIFQKEKMSRGTIVVGLAVEPDVQVIQGLSSIDLDYDEILDTAFPDLGSAKTMLLFVDGLSTRIAALIASLFNIFGLEINYLGGGAGSLSFEQKPCLFTNKGLLQDAAVMALLDIESGVGVQHGWRTISGPHRVTEAQGTTIKSLDWEPAFDVYRRVVEAASGKHFTNDNFFDIAKGYPFGINKINAEKVVRDPIMVGEGGQLICVGEVPEESYVDILQGNTTSLVEAARKALQLGQDTFEGTDTNQFNLFIDCISRVLFLEDDFQQELEAVYRQDTMLVGALTLGEIANNGRDYLEFYNKTAVIGVLAG